MTKVHIDILKTEMENDLPYWLSFEGRNADKMGKLRADIRKKHREKYLAQQRAKMKAAKAK